VTSQTPTWSASPPSGRAAPGTLIGGRYTLRAAIGTGGMGTVWRASDTLLRREVAVKEVVCPPGMAPSDRDAMYERTLREARAAAALSHPSVVQVYDVVTEDGRPWIVMELLDARSLADIVIEDGPLAPRAVAKIGIALLGALEVAHAAGVLHRDVKPANVLICSDGRCVLTDFGVARMPTDIQLTTPGMVLGSPHFISPERAMGGAFGPPSDLFSLGVSLYTAVEGRPPFDRGDPIETMHAVVEDPPAPPVRASALADVLSGLLEKDPDRRWNVAAARSALRDLVAGPLANKARDHVTDPYAVVPTQRPSWSPPPAVQNGHIGGRAMLSPEESLEEAIAKARAGTPDVGDQSLDASPAEGGDPSGPVDEWGQPGAPWVPSSPPAVTPSWGGATGLAHDAPTWGGPGPDLSGGTGYGGAGTGLDVGRPSFGGAGSSEYRHSGGLLESIRRWPRTTKLAVGGSLAAVLLLGTIALSNGWFSSPPDSASPPGPAPTSPTGPPFAVQQHTQGVITVNVPAGWKKTQSSGYVDFVDPSDSGRRVRINIEQAADARKFLEGAEKNLKKPNNCPTPYNRVDLQDATLAGQPAAQLEYMCGQGDKMRHGIWRATVVGGKAYHFYLTVPHTRFDESKVIFEEMVNSFKLGL
jgi:serine/threonine protein kinase